MNRQDHERHQLTDVPTAASIAAAVVLIGAATAAAVTATLTGHTRLGLAISGLVAAVGAFLALTAHKESR